MFIEIVYDDEERSLLIEGFGPNTIVGAVKDLVHGDGLYDGERRIDSILITENIPAGWNSPPPNKIE